MLPRLMLIFIIVPFLEIWLLIQAGRAVGFLPTLASLLIVSLIGAWLTRSQGVRTIVAIRDELALGRIPAAHFLDGALILAGGILLLTPGFFTDLVGLLLLLPVTRASLKGWLRCWLEQRLSRGCFVIRRH